MKLKYYILFILLSIGSITVTAQEKLAVEPLFKKYKSAENVVMVHIAGNDLDIYNLSLYTSISTTDVTILNEFNNAVTLDATSASQSKEVVKDGKLISGYYQLNGKNEKNKFIFFKRDSQGSGMIILMEGETNLNDLVKLLITKNT